MSENKIELLDRPKYHITPDGAIVVDGKSFFRVKRVQEQVKYIRKMDAEIRRRASTGTGK